MIKKKFSGIYGVILDSAIGNGQLLSISMPKKNGKYFTISNNDIKGKRFFEVDNQRLEIFANKQIRYLGQPILGIFGNDYEDLDYIYRETEFSYRITDNDISSSQINSNLFYKESFSFGAKYQTKSEDDIKKYTTTTTLDRVKSNQIINFEVNVFSQNGKTYIHTPAQDKDLVINAVSSVCNIKSEDIVILPKDGYGFLDEFLICPVFASVIATLAHIKSKQSVCLLSPALSERPKTIIERTTSILDSRFIKQEINVTVDQGYKCLYSKEISKQMLAGLLPLYKVDEVIVNFSFYTSNNKASNFFGDLGHTSAQISNEVHSTFLAKALDMFPNEFQLKYYGTGTDYKYTNTLDITILKELIKKTVKDSSFNREYATSDMYKLNLQSPTNLVNYTRGIGIASGGGIFNFSKDTDFKCKDYIGVKLTKDNKVEIYTSINVSSDTYRTYNSIVKNILDIDKIEFIDEDYDSGPTLLSRDTGILADKLEQCCIQIKKQRFKKPLPIFEDSSNYNLIKAEYMFESQNWASIVTSLEIDLITLRPRVKNIWASFYILGDRDKLSIKNKIKHTIVSTLSDQGIELATDFSLKIDISQNKKTWGNFSSSSIRPLVIASCTSALSQALKTEVNKLPINSEQILKYIRGEK